jgi:NADPH:quinone reductase-like Zn-dependent oxidoreductase
MGTWEDEKVMHAQLGRIVQGIQTGHLEPIIDQIFDAEDVQKAHQHIHDAKNIGKVLLKFEDVEG